MQDQLQNPLKLTCKYVFIKDDVRCTGGVRAFMFAEVRSYGNCCFLLSETAKRGTLSGPALLLCTRFITQKFKL